MEKKEMEMEDVIDLSVIFKLLKKYWVLLAAVGIVCGIAAYCVAEFMIPKKYQSQALLYVENNQQTSESLNINDINAAQKLVNTCQIIFKSSTMMDNLIANLDLPYNKATLNEMITAQSVNNTEVMKLVVESSSPQESAEIVNELVRLANIEFSRIIKSGSIEVIDYGEVNTKASYPHVLQITVIGAFAGVIIVFAILFIIDLLDVAVKHDDNLARRYDIPLFAEISEFSSASSTKYGYGYGQIKRKKAAADSVKEFNERLLNDDTPFAITEAYNTARTNIMFSAATAERKIIAVTSSNPSEGKSTTCSNIAISFANAGHKVILVECDLRKPTMAKNFGLKSEGGLSSVLGGFTSVSEVLRKNVRPNLDIITAGDIPPNPSELLGSVAMQSFLEAAAQSYDYVFLDTPPVNVVTDSQLTNDIIAGIVFIVRESSTTHPDIQNALEKIRLANGKALGFVKTFCSAGKHGRYGKYGKYGYYKYGYSLDGEENKEASEAKA